MRISAVLAALIACTAAGEAPTIDKDGGEFDYLIVGGGLTGLVVAARLTEDPNVSVLVLEYGEFDRRNVTKIPYYAGVRNLDSLRIFTSAPEPYLDDYELPILVGATPGGGSQVNGMEWDLPSKADYDAFAKLGNPGWDWEGLKPYYDKATQLSPPDPEIEVKYNYTYDLSAYGGPQSPLKVSYPEFQYVDMYNFKDGFTELGVPFVEEHARGNAVGQFWTPASTNKKDNTRSTSLYNYYDPASDRPNLRLLPMHQVTEIIFDEDEGLTATGVRATNRKTNAEESFRASKEVILAAGGVYTPQVLQLSGIGPKGVLEAAGVETKLDFPAVGSNFQDHPTAYLSWNITSSFPNPSTLATNATFFEEAKQLYLSERTGPLTKPLSTYIGFLSLETIAGTEDAASLLDEAEAASPGDFLPSIYAKDERLVAGFKAQRDVLTSAIRAGEVAVLEIPIPGGGLLPASMQKPLSRGTVHLNATNPLANPTVLYNSLSHPFDRRTLHHGINFTRRLVNTSAVAPLHPIETMPGANYTSLASILPRLLAAGAYEASFRHPSCSCPMMPREMGGVVDSELRVYGTRGLRVVDASVLPVIPAAHLQATMYAVAEKAADVIKGKG